MMSEILLTDIEVMQVAHVGDRTEVDAICRAQVWKVGKDMVGRGEAGMAALPDGEQGFWKGYWQALIDQGQALKAAGEDDAPPTPIKYDARTELGKRLVDLRNKAAGEGK